jgi:hypothetical protein
MGEPRRDIPLKKHSPAGEFNELVHHALETKRHSGMYISGVATSEEQGMFEEWLARPGSQEFLERADRKNWKSLGVVIDLKPWGDGTVDISYVDQYGMPMGFTYIPGSSRFALAPVGFHVGDYIINEFSDGYNFTSVRPVSFPQKTEDKIRRKFLQLIEAHKRR